MVDHRSEGGYTGANKGQAEFGVSPISGIYVGPGQVVAVDIVEGGNAEYSCDTDSGRGN